MVLPASTMTTTTYSMYKVQDILNFFMYVDNKEADRKLAIFNEPIKFKEMDLSGKIKLSLN